MNSLTTLPVVERIERKIKTGMIKKILLIDDDRDSCILLQRLLKDGGYEIETLHEGTSIVEGSYTCPDLFIIDNTLPTIDGFAICKFLRLQERSKDKFIVMISGNHNLKDKSLAAGANYFLPKPFRVQQLIELIVQGYTDIKPPVTEKSAKAA
jgi:DNA-binding response OmpR family regulator